MSKAGIFDPWRQNPEPQEQPAEPKGALRIEDALEHEDETQESCISFPGRRGRLNVWFARPDATLQDGAASVVDLFLALWGKGHAQALRTAGIDVAVHKDWLPLQNNDGKSIYIDTDDSKDAVDIVVFALRDLLENPQAERLIKDSNVKALVI